MVVQHQNRGLVKQGTNHAVVAELPLPSLRDDYILVKTVAVALNPTDWQDLDEDFEPGAKPLLMGCDYAGIVEAVGKNVTKGLQQGDRVMGLVHGTNEACPEDGSFAEHIVAKGDICMRIPSHLSFTDAATLPAGLATVALGLYKHLGLPFPPETVTSGSWLLVYGGSSATGSLAIQFAKLYLWVEGCYTTCSPRNFDFVRRRGADAVFDYHDPGCAEKIRQCTSDDLTQVFDTIATLETAKISAESMSSRKGGAYCNLMGVDAPREDVKSIFFLGYNAIGEAFYYERKEWPVVPEDYVLAKTFGILAEELLEQGKIQPHPAAVRSGGLGAILSGLEDMKRGKVSGQKLVSIIGNNH
ncbi:protein TOXD [Lipomyces kononenkoae]|uniref:Protein TOXD n=1 Tax=Lipomyces kononenkoae TaxID=34357 RepID=A0ACC3T177_LIPKO